MQRISDIHGAIRKLQESKYGQHLPHDTVYEVVSKNGDSHTVRAVLPAVYGGVRIAYEFHVTVQDPGAA